MPQTWTPFQLTSGSSLYRHLRCGTSTSITPYPQTLIARGHKPPAPNGQLPFMGTLTQQGLTPDKHLGVPGRGVTGGSLPHEARTAHRAACGGTFTTRSPHGQVHRRAARRTVAGHHPDHRTYTRRVNFKLLGVRLVCTASVWKVPIQPSGLPAALSVGGYSIVQGFPGDCLFGLH